MGRYCELSKDRARNMGRILAEAENIYTQKEMRKIKGASRQKSQHVEKKKTLKNKNYTDKELRNILSLFYQRIY